MHWGHDCMEEQLINFDLVKKTKQNQETENKVSNLPAKTDTKISLPAMYYVFCVFCISSDLFLQTTFLIKILCETASSWEGPGNSCVVLWSLGPSLCVNLCAQLKFIPISLFSKNKSLKIKM